MMSTVFFVLFTLLSISNSWAISTCKSLLNPDHPFRGYSGLVRISKNDIREGSWVVAKYRHSYFSKSDKDNIVFGRVSEVRYDEKDNVDQVYLEVKIGFRKQDKIDFEYDNSIKFWRLLNSDTKNKNLFWTLTQYWDPSPRLESSWQKAVIKDFNEGKDTSHFMKGWGDYYPSPKRTWFRDLIQLPVEKVFGSKNEPVIAEKKVGGSGGSEVYEFNSNGKSYFFRPLSNKQLNVVRKTFLIHKFNRFLGLKTVPDAFWGEVHFTVEGQKSHKLGVVSEKALGEIKDVDVESMLENSEPQVASAQGFEYWIGNIDLSWHNFSSDGKSKIEVFDHGHALITKFIDKVDSLDPMVEPFSDMIGFDPPKIFSKELKVAVQKDLSPFFNEWGYLFHESELQAMENRRQILEAAITL